jgi:predicted RNA binding protein YcfA (HicA-like mRNA interferase family)
MTSKQLIKFAKSLGWVLARNGSKHQIFTHENSTRRVIIPYHTRDHVGTLIKKQLLAGVA